jgi:putative ABC transport system permease protein
MLKSYCVVAWRNLLRNKIFSLINVTGLAIGLGVGFLIYQYVQAELSYDRFHKNADRIYRLPISYSGSFASLRPSATNHPALGPALKADFPEVEDYTRLVRASLFLNTATVSYEKDASEPRIFNEERVYIADQSFLSVFSFPMVAGDPANALKEPASIVITKSVAEKYFGNEPALGKILKLARLDFKVTGVLQDIPENSHLQFDILLSFSTLGGDNGNTTFFDTNWTWPEFYNYVLLKPHTDPVALEAKFPAFMKKYLGKIWEEHKFQSRIYLQPLTDIHLKSDLGLEQDANGSERTVYFLSVLALFILVIAWINYVNLSTAKSLERSKEVGLRKVSGATKNQLVIQFFFDAFLVNILAVALAAVLLIISLPYFENLTGKDISGVLESTGAWHSLSFWGIVLGTLTLGIIIVGLYPAILVSSFNPAVVLKGKFIKSQAGIRLRKGLLIFQYVLSIFLIAGTITIYRQLSYMQAQDLGYNKEQVLVVRAAAIVDSTFATKVQYFKNEMLQMPALVNITASSEIPGNAITDRNTIRKIGDEAKDNVPTYIVEIDDEFIETFEMAIAAGRNFDEKDQWINDTGNEKKLTDDGYLVSGGQNRVMVNEDLAEKLGFETPEDALHQVMRFTMGREYAVEVIGVVKNYHQLSLKEKYDPIVYLYPGSGGSRYYSLRLNTGNLTETIATVKKAYAEAFPSNPFEYFFLDDHFNMQYKADVQFGTLFGVFTMLGIMIAGLGLFGLGVFTTTQRTREIGIRKVLGANVSAILMLFSKESVRLLIISYAIAVPLMYLGIQNWLKNFAFHIGIGWQIFLFPLLFLIGLSVTTIVLICLRAALLSPAISLRHE